MQTPHYHTQPLGICRPHPCPQQTEHVLTIALHGDDGSLREAVLNLDMRPAANLKLLVLGLVALAVVVLIAVACAGVFLGGRLPGLRVGSSLSGRPAGRGRLAHGVELDRRALQVPVRAVGAAVQGHFMVAGPGAGLVAGARATPR